MDITHVIFTHMITLGTCAMSWSPHGALAWVNDDIDRQISPNREPKPNNPNIPDNPDNPGNPGKVKPAMKDNRNRNNNNVNNKVVLDTPSNNPSNNPSNSHHQNNKRNTPENGDLFLLSTSNNPSNPGSPGSPEDNPFVYMATHYLLDGSDLIANNPNNPNNPESKDLTGVEMNNPSKPTGECELDYSARAFREVNNPDPRDIHLYDNPLITLW